MNAQERLRVERLVMRLAQQPDRPKDRDAERELATLMKVRPDAPYLLMELALILEMSLEQSQAELERLRQAQRTAYSGGHAPSHMLPPRHGLGYPMGSGMPSPLAASGGSSFLRNAAAVAAGVVGGSLLFQGLENMFDSDEHHHHHYGADQDPMGLQDTGFAGGNAFDSGPLNDSGGFGGMDESDWV